MALETTEMPTLRKAVVVYRGEHTRCQEIQRLCNTEYLETGWYEDIMNGSNTLVGCEEYSLAKIVRDGIPREAKEKMKEPIGAKNWLQTE